VWKITCACNLVTGLFELSGCFLGNLVRTGLTKAALYCPILAVGYVYLATAPLYALGEQPIVGFLPFAFVWTGFFSNGGEGVYRSKYFIIPVALVMLGIGSGLGWAGLNSTYKPGSAPTTDEMEDALNAADDYLLENNMRPFASLTEWDGVKDYLALVFPVALQSFVETMENVEAACFKGDHYNVQEAMIADGLGTIIGAAFGSPLPTTVYIGHARHKAVNASAGYSVLNAITYCCFLNLGMFGIVYRAVDPLAINLVLLAVGLMIAKQAFVASKPKHYPALFIGLIVVSFDWVRLNFVSVTVSREDIPGGLANWAAGGGIMVSLILTQIICDLIDLRFASGMFFSFLAAVFSATGIMHGNNNFSHNGTPIDLGELTFVITRGQCPDGTRESDTCLNEGIRFTIGYGLVFGFCAIHWVLQRIGWLPTPDKAEDKDAAVDGTGSGPQGDL